MAVETTRNRSDPEAGRWIVVAAGAIGLVAVIAYGVQHSDDRAAGRAAVAEPAAAPMIDELLSRAEAARRSLDVRALAEVEGELEAAATQAGASSQGGAARLALAESVSTRALEASIRAELDASARTEATSAIARARELVEDLARYPVDRGRLEAVRARVALAAGEDVTESFPVVLMPTYRDPELRLATIAAPVWRASTAASAGSGPDARLAAIVTEEFARAEPQTNLVRDLYAIAALSAADEGGARGAIDLVLTEVPSQPLALALRRRIEGQAPPVVVAAEDGKAETKVATPPLPEEDPVVIDDEPPEPKPETKSPTVEKPPTLEKPTPEKPTPTADAEGEPKPPKPVSEPAPSAKSAYAQLLSDGCKKVRGGDPDGGLALLQQAHDLRPGAVDVVVCMAEAHHALGRDASARAMVQRALAKDPKDKRGNLLAALLEDARGNVSGAIAHYRKVLAVDNDNATATKYLEKHGQTP